MATPTGSLSLSAGNLALDIRLTAPLVGQTRNLSFVEARLHISNGWRFNLFFQKRSDYLKFNDVQLMDVASQTSTL